MLAPIGVALIVIIATASVLAATPATARAAAAAGAPGAFTTSDGLQAKEDSALLDGTDFGLNAFERNAKGTARAMEGQPAGYRFPLAKGATLVVVRAPSAVLVWVDARAAAKAGFDTESDAGREALTRMLTGLDESHSMGGALLADVSDPWTFTTEDELTVGDYTYRFRVRGDDGDDYAVVTASAQAADPAALDLGDGALWSDDAQIVPVADVAVTEPPSTWDRAASFFSKIDYRPLWVSVKTSGIALIFSFILGLLAAWRCMGTSSRLKGVLDSVFTIPMVLPPTVCGFLLLMLFGQSTEVGRWLIDHGVSLVFTWPAAVISAAVVSFPLMYRTALGAFESLDAQMLDAARTLGWSEGRIFRKLMMPLGWPSIAAGTVLAFARAMGEFGCTLFFAGNYAGITQTIPIAIYFQWMAGDTPVAMFWVVVVIAFSFLVILFINIYTAHSQRYRSRGMAGRGRRSRSRAGGGDGADAAGDSLDAGGDALRIDREALRELLLGEGAGASADAGAPSATGSDPIARAAKGGE